MKKTSVILLCLAVFLTGYIPAAAASGTFWDVATTHWAYGSIESAYAKGLMVGTGNGQFAPETTLTRAQVAQITYNAYSANLPDDRPVSVADVSANAWYQKPAAWLLACGLADLSEDGNFYPNAPAPRRFIADVLYKLSTKLGASLPAENAAVTFPDLATVTAEQKIAIAALQRAGVISGYGDGTFGPERSLTRAEMAKLMDVYTNLAGLQSSATPPAVTPPSSTPPPVSAGGFDWVDVATTYEGNLKPYAESLGFTCEHVQQTAMVVGSPWILNKLYFTKGDTIVVVRPFPSSECYSIFIGKSSESPDEATFLGDFTNSSEVKAAISAALQ